MKRLIVFCLAVLPLAAHAESYFEVFNGKYQVKSRQCGSGDSACLNLKFIDVGYDANELRSYVVETYADGSQVKIIIEEDQMPGVSNWITGDYGTRVIWTHTDTKNGDYNSETVSLTKIVESSYSRTINSNNSGISISRKFITVKK